MKGHSLLYEGAQPFLYVKTLKGNTVDAHAVQRASQDSRQFKKTGDPDGGAKDGPGGETAN